MITLDTSALFALMNRRDPDHVAVREALEKDRGPYLVPAGVLAEITYLLEHRYGAATLDAFLGDLEAGRYRLDCGERDMPRIRALVKRYADLPLGFADAAVIACAEHHSGAVLTLDRPDFTVVAGEAAITVLP